jgi:biopolymer transport protein ExbD
MAQMENSSDNKRNLRAGVRKSKKLDTRIDLTPMVDLGFLLISFFMVTTTMANPKTMELNMPYKDAREKYPETRVKDHTALTVLLSGGHKVYFYEGMGNDPDKPPLVGLATFTDKAGIRAVISAKRRAVNNLIMEGTLSAKDQTTVLIKPDTNSTYSDLVGILDEMAINDIRVYAVVDITETDRQLISNAHAGTVKTQ